MRNLLNTVQTRIQPEYFFWAAVVCSVFFAFDTRGAALPNEATVALAVKAPIENPFDSVALVAKAAYVYDVKGKKQLFAKNAEDILPLASVTKIMTAATALSLIPETTYVTIDEEAIRTEGDSGLRVGERWLLRDLLAFTLIESSNDGAVAVSLAVGGALATSSVSGTENRTLFVREMNALAASIGLHSTRFLNESGLDIDAEHAGAYSTAAETARMFAYALEKFPGVFKETRWNELTLGSEKETHAAQNTNKETNGFPLLIASKTGYTDLAGGNLVIAFDAGFNHPIIISVLGSTTDGRFADAETLLWATLQSL